MIGKSEWNASLQQTIIYPNKIGRNKLRGAIFLKISKKTGNEMKKVEKHQFMICKQKQKIEAKYSSASNAGNEEII